MALSPQQIADKVIFLLGEPCEDIISYDTIITIVNDCIAEIGDDDDLYCKVLQCSLLSTLRYLIRKDQMSESTAGNIKRRKEEIGKRKIEEEYQIPPTVNVKSGWEKMYDDYKENPDWICSSLAKNSGSRLVMIGGVREDEYLRVASNPNSRTAYKRPRTTRKWYGDRDTVRGRKR